jgi:uncharacterized oligopeptide transporter (OPT) family protein
LLFLVTLPLCLGIAPASGAPLFAGLTAGIVGGIVAGLLSASPLSVSGPAVGLTTIVALAIIKLGFNVIEQVYNLSQMSIIQNSWATRLAPYVHGWVYDLRSGLIKDLHVTMNDNSSMTEVYKFEVLS